MGSSAGLTSPIEAVSRFFDTRRKPDLTVRLPSCFAAGDAEFCCAPAKNVIYYFRTERLEAISAMLCGRRPDAPWLIFFEERLCEDYNASGRNTRCLCQNFKAPVLAFSLFDSGLL